MDNRVAAHELEIAVSRYEAPMRWREWGGDWTLASEMSEFLELVKSRQDYWRESYVVGQRRLWWGAMSRPSSLLGVVIVDSGHGWELGGLGDVLGRVVDGVEETGEEEGAVVVTGLWLLGCHIEPSTGCIVDGGGSSGRVRAPDIVLRRRHRDDVVDVNDILIPCYAHRGSSVLLQIPLKQSGGVSGDVVVVREEAGGEAGGEEEERREKAFWSLRGVKFLVQ